MGRRVKRAAEAESKSRGVEGPHEHVERGGRGRGQRREQEGKRQRGQETKRGRSGASSPFDSGSGPLDCCQVTVGRSIPGYCQVTVGWSLDRMLTFPCFGLIKKRKKLERGDGEAGIGSL